MSSFRPELTTDLKIAVELWVSDNTSALLEYGPINEWDTSLITNMRLLFNQQVSFNDDISDWDVSNVTNMQEMFKSANKFNQPIGNWDVSNVTSMNKILHQDEIARGGSKKSI
jgi:surface protein